MTGGQVSGAAHCLMFQMPVVKAGRGTVCALCSHLWKRVVCHLFQWNIVEISQPWSQKAMMLVCSALQSSQFLENRQVYKLEITCTAR